MYRCSRCGSPNEDHLCAWWFTPEGEAQVEGDGLEACYEERAARASQLLEIGGPAEREEWDTYRFKYEPDGKNMRYEVELPCPRPPACRIGDPHSHRYTGVFGEPPVVDDKTGLLQGERVSRTWHSLYGQHIETNMGNHYVLRESAMNPNARWERA